MLIVEKKPKSAVSEFYRKLRTNIEYLSFDTKIKTILVTSSQSKEGKSTICGNMALTFAENEKKVLLLDCDLRKPTVHKLFNISNVCGLSEVLIGTKKLDEVIRTYNGKLDILPCGTITPNPPKMIESETMGNLLESLKEIYDVIILDSSPINAVTDPQILSTKADGTILIIKKDTTKIDDVLESKKLLEKVGANIIGCIFNGTEAPGKRNYIYYVNKKTVKA